MPSRACPTGKHFQVWTLKTLCIVINVVRLAAVRNVRGYKTHKGIVRHSRLATTAQKDRFRNAAKPEPNSRLRLVIDPTPAPPSSFSQGAPVWLQERSLNPRLREMSSTEAISEVGLWMPLTSGLSPWAAVTSTERPSANRGHGSPSADHSAPGHGWARVRQRRPSPLDGETL